MIWYQSDLIMEFVYLLEKTYLNLHLIFYREEFDLAIVELGFL